MKNYIKVYSLIFVCLVCATCKKTVLLEIPLLDCNNSIPNLEMIQNAIIGEWSSVEIEGNGEALISQRAYTAEFLFLDQSNCTKIITWNDTNETTVNEYSYEIKEATDSEEVFILELARITPAQLSIQLCDDVLLISDDNHWEKYEHQ